MPCFEFVSRFERGDTIKENEACVSQYQQFEVIRSAAVPFFEGFINFGAVPAIPRKEHIEHPVQMEMFSWVILQNVLPISLWGENEVTCEQLIQIPSHNTHCQVEEPANGNYLLQFIATFGDQLPVDTEMKDISEQCSS